MIALIAQRPMLAETKCTQKSKRKRRPITICENSDPRHYDILKSSQPTITKRIPGSQWAESKYAMSKGMMWRWSTSADQEGWI
jgi:hypothetical protein